MATFVKGKNSSAYFKKLTWTSIPWEFQSKATLISLEKMLQPTPLFSVTRALYPGNMFVTKFYDSLMFRCLWLENPSGTSIFFVLHVWVILVMKGAGPPFKSIFYILPRRNIYIAFTTFFCIYGTVVFWQRHFMYSMRAISENDHIHQ